MNFITQMSADQFESLCTCLLKEHALKDRDITIGSFFSTWLPYYSDFEEDFQFTRRAGRSVAIWLTGYYTSTENPSFGIYIKVYECKYLSPQQMAALGTAEALADSLAIDLETAIQSVDQEHNYGVFDKLPGLLHVGFTVLTNSFLCPDAGAPSLFELIDEKVKKIFRNSTSEIGTAVSLFDALSVNTGIQSQEDGSSLEAQLQVVKEKFNTYLRQRTH